MRRMQRRNHGGKSHQVFYKSTRKKVEYIYYRCIKKLKPCNQKYISENDFEEQLRQIFGNCGLHKGWESYFEKWITEVEEKDKIKSEVEIKNLNAQIQ